MEKEKKSLVEKFKGLSKKNKIVLMTTIIAIVTIVIITIIAIIASNNKSTPTVSQLENNNTLQNNMIENTNLLTSESDNYYGMHFNKTMPEFCESFNKALENEYEQLGENTETIGLYTLEPTDFSYYTTDEQMKLKQYNANGINYNIMLFTELDSEYIVYACVGYDTSNVVYKDNLLNLIGSKIYPAIGSALTNLSYSNMLDNFGKITPEKNYTYFNNNVCYIYRQEGNTIYQYVVATTEEKYNETNNPTTTDNTTTETNSSEVAGIEQMIGFLNSYYDLNFNPTDEQMQEIIEFSNTTDEFNNDTLMEFILQKGWTVSGTGTVDNSSGTTSNSNNSSSNNNNTNKNSNDSNTSTYKEIKATLSINIKDLINNSTDPEVETILQSNTLQVSIFVDGSKEGSEYLMYHGGIDSIPNTITEDFRFETTNNDSVKSNVRIVIDNTSTMIRESTLYDKSITFDKTGTYTIK